MRVQQLLPLALLTVMACNPKPKQESVPSAAEGNGAIVETEFGTLPDGQVVSLFTLTNQHRLEMKVTNYGGLIVSLKTPNRSGLLEDIVLGYDSLAGYLRQSPLFGALVGRYANRISNAKFKLDGKEYPLVANNGTNSIHGGRRGFDKVVWKPEKINTPEGPALKLSYLSKDGEEGFPGNLNVEVIYTLNNNDELKIGYRATTDKTTIVNLTNHSYFNLTGNAKGDVLDHLMKINADSVVEIDKIMIPTGKIKSVAGTALDFISPRRIGERIDSKDEQIALGHGYDHCFVLKGASGELKVAVTVFEPTSGRMLEVSTTLPGVQIYSGNFLSGSITGKGGVVYKRRYGICFETGLFPDAPNRPEFPSPALKPGEVYNTETIFKFGTR